VVHSMGILLEVDYKGVLQGKESLWSGLSSVFGAMGGAAAQNPLERRPGEDADPRAKASGGKVTYELMNRDSGGYHDAVIVSRVDADMPPTS
jgi:hypothetical protein